jgi:hypothetical protein
VIPVDLPPEVIDWSPEEDNAAFNLWMKFAHDCRTQANSTKDDRAGASCSPALKGRFSNLNKGVNGSTVDEYARRVRLVLNDFDDWTADRAGWERNAASKARPTSGDRVKTKADKPKTNGAQHSAADNTSKRAHRDAHRVVSAQRQLRDGREDPETGVRVPDLKRAFIGLLPYASDWEVDHPLHDIPFMQIGRDGL